MNTKRKISLILLGISICLTGIVLSLAADTFNLAAYLGTGCLYAATIAGFIINLFILAVSVCFFLDSVDV